MARLYCVGGQRLGHTEHVLGQVFGRRVRHRLCSKIGPIGNGGGSIHTARAKGSVGQQLVQKAEDG